MVRLAKWFGVLVLALLVAAMLGLGGLVLVSRSREGERYDVSVALAAAPVTPERLAEGQRLFFARGCADCHGEEAQGRVVMDAPPALVVATNLTTLPADTSLADFARAVRNGVAPDGRPLLFMPSREYYAMSDGEVLALFDYVKSLPAQPNELPKGELRVLGRALHAAGLFPAYSAEHIQHAAPRPAEVPVARNAAYGAYLASGCTGCHGEQFSGGPVPGAPPEVVGIPPNLTPDESGLKGWTETDFFAALREGRTPSGATLDPKKMPWRSMSKMTDTELGALWAFLQTVPARPEGNR